VFYNVRSERELMETLPERLDWLWFLGYELDSEIPNHSVLSKARKRWGVDIFKGLFERLVWQCVEAGLVDGNKLFMDSSLVQADASNNSVVDKQSLKYQLNDHYQELEQRLEEVDETIQGQSYYRKQNDRYISTTDPDAAIVRRGRAKLMYQTHRAVDGQSEIITATEVTPGDVNEAHRMIALWEQHQLNTHRQAGTVVADSKYGTIDNFLACHDRGLQAHMPDLKKAGKKRVQHRGIFPDTEFVYDAQTDTYGCPAGHQLKRKSLHRHRQSIDYAAPKQACDVCPLRPQCTRNKTSGRTIKRHLRQTELEQMRQRSHSPAAKRDIRTRQHLMERSFARASRYGFDRARWRGLWRVQIQEYLTASIQNIETLIRYGGTPKKRFMSALTEYVPSKHVTKDWREIFYLPSPPSLLFSY
jgi:IS5 family transposase